MAASTRSTLPVPTLMLIVLALMAVLYSIDKFLAAQEQSEQRQDAHSHYTSGQKLLAAANLSLRSPNSRAPIPSSVQIVSTCWR